MINRIEYTIHTTHTHIHIHIHTHTLLVERQLTRSIVSIRFFFVLFFIHLKFG
jgi:hypothetical protein